MLTNMASHPRRFIASLVITTVFLLMFVYKMDWLDDDGSKRNSLLVHENVTSYGFGQGALMEKRMAERLRTISSFCRNESFVGSRNNPYPSSSSIQPMSPKYDALFIDKEHSLVYCRVLKVASATTINWLLRLKGLTQEEIVNQFSNDGPTIFVHDVGRKYYPVTNYSLAEQFVKKARTKFMVVRHPFDRLLSAYRNKLEKKEHDTLRFYDRYGRHIVEKYRPKDSNLTQVECTFKEFIDYIIDLEMSADINNHWLPYYLCCAPCLVQYDVIIHLDTFESDFQFLLDRMSIRIRPEWMNSSETNGTSVVKRYFSTVKRSALVKLYEKLRPDFEMFGYSPEAHFNMARDG